MHDAVNYSAVNVEAHARAHLHKCQQNAKCEQPQRLQTVMDPLSKQTTAARGATAHPKSPRTGIGLRLCATLSSHDGIRHIGSVAAAFARGAATGSDVMSVEYLAAIHHLLVECCPASRQQQGDRDMPLLLVCKFPVRKS